MIMAIPFKTDGVNQQEVDQEFLTRFIIQFIHILQSLQSQDQEESVEHSDTSATQNSDANTERVTINNDLTVNTAVVTSDQQNGRRFESHRSQRSATIRGPRGVSNARKTRKIQQRLPFNDQKLSNEPSALKNNLNVDYEFRRNDSTQPCCSCSCSQQANTAAENSTGVVSEDNLRIPDIQTSSPGLPDLIPNQNHHQTKEDQLPDLLQNLTPNHDSKKRPKTKFRLNVFDDSRMLQPKPDTVPPPTCQQDFATVGRQLRNIAENFRCQTITHNINEHHHPHVHENQDVPHHQFGQDQFDGYQPHNHGYHQTHPDNQQQSSGYQQSGLINALIDAGLISAIRSVIRPSAVAGQQYTSLSPCRLGLLLAGCFIFRWIQNKY